jgi:hypothetical protein
MAEATTHPIWERLREVLQTATIYKINPGYPGVVKTDEMEQIWDREDIISIATWSTDGPLGLADAHDGDPITITADIVDPDFYDEFDQEFQRDPLREAVLEEEHGDDEDELRSAAQQAGSLLRFFNGMVEGMPIVANFSDGAAFATVTDEAMYHPGNPAMEQDPGHKYYREVEWYRRDDGRIITIPYEALPDTFDPGRTTTSGVKNPEQLVQVARVIDFLLDGTA